MRMFFLIATAALALSGCADPTANWTPEQRMQFMRDAWARQQSINEQNMANIRAVGQSYHQNQPKPPTNCISNVIGNSVYTNCN